MLSGALNSLTTPEHERIIICESARVKSEVGDSPEAVSGRKCSCQAEVSGHRRPKKRLIELSRPADSA